MKRSVILCMATLIAFSCAKEVTNVSESLPETNSQESPSLKVSVEEATKASFDEDYKVQWETGEEIKVRVYKGSEYKGTDSGSKYQAKDMTWTLDAETSGSFKPSEDIDQWHHWGYAAFYPCFDNNISGYNGVAYFHFQSTYNSYNPGTMLMPMVANMKNGDTYETRPSTASFMHVGSAIIVTLDKVPASANKITLTVNQNITGWGGINPADAGTDYISSSELSGDDLGTTITINFEQGTEVRDGLKFIFPVPTLTDPTLTLNLYSDNRPIMHIGPTKAQPSLGRADCLIMPTIDVSERLIENTITVYIKDNTGWSNRALHFWKDGDVQTIWPGISSSGTKEMYYSTYYKFELPASIKGKKYNLIYNNTSYGEGNQTGTYEITFGEDNTYYLKATSSELASYTPNSYSDWESSSWGITGSIASAGISWNNDIPMVTNGTWYVAKGVVLTTTDEFKFRKGGVWDENFGGALVVLGTEFAVTQNGANIKVKEDDTYDLLLNPSTGFANVVKTGDDPSN